MMPATGNMKIKELQASSGVLRLPSAFNRQHGCSFCFVAAMKVACALFLTIGAAATALSSDDLSTFGACHTRSL
jgi:hypothetical protein